MVRAPPECCLLLYALSSDVGQTPTRLGNPPMPELTPIHTADSGTVGGVARERSESESESLTARG